jgi:hypothetical protein
MDGDANHVQGLRATRNLLAMIREAVAGDGVEGRAAQEAWRAHHLASAPGDFVVVVTREAHQVLPGTRMQVMRCDGSDLWWFGEDESGCSAFPMQAEAACRRLNDWGAQVIVDDDRTSYQPDTWLALIDRVLEALVGLGCGPEGTEAARCVVAAILTGHLPLGHLLAERSLALIPDAEGGTRDGQP